MFEVFLQMICSQVVLGTAGLEFDLEKAIVNVLYETVAERILVSKEQHRLGRSITGSVPFVDEGDPHLIIDHPLAGVMVVDIGNDQVQVLTINLCISLIAEGDQISIGLFSISNNSVADGDNVSEQLNPPCLAHLRHRKPGSDPVST